MVADWALVAVSGGGRRSDGVLVCVLLQMTRCEMAVFELRCGLAADEAPELLPELVLAAGSIPPRRVVVVEMIQSHAELLRGRRVRWPAFYRIRATLLSSVRCRRVLTCFSSTSDEPVSLSLAGPAIAVGASAAARRLVFPCLLLRFPVRMLSDDGGGVIAGSTAPFECAPGRDGAILR